MSKILIVEDGMIIALHLQKFLENNGYSVVGKLTRGEEVVNAVKKHEPDLILMDIMLEGRMTGIEAVAKVRTFSEIPVLYMSALTDSHTMKEVNAHKNCFKLDKPFQDDLLSNLLEDILN